MAHQMLPVGAGRGGTSSKDDRGERGRFARKEIVLQPGDRHPDPPAPPRWLVDPRAIELYMEAWTVPVSVLWSRPVAACGTGVAAARRRR
jgi:hypothetical protein